jgi:hypothetical protein
MVCLILLCIILKIEFESKPRDQLSKCVGPWTEFWPKRSSEEDNVPFVSLA